MVRGQLVSWGRGSSTPPPLPLPPQGGWATWSLRCVSVQNFHCWSTSDSLSRPPWWK
jgi:hypothetical protein